MASKAKFRTMQRGDCARLRDEVTEALTKLGEQVGLVFDPIGRITYDPTMNTARFRVECAVAGGTSGGTPAESKERRDFRANCERFGFEESDLDREFADPFDRKRFTINGLRIKARKNNIVVRDVRSGKNYVMPHRTVLQCLGKKSPDAGLRSILEG